MGIYRDGNKSPETRYYEMYAHSSKSEQASEITMKPALQLLTHNINSSDIFRLILFSPHVLNTATKSV